MSKVNSLNSARFELAAHRISQLLPDSGAEVAFAGRSNSGKSSALNALTNHSRLARTSKVPGRTQQIVFFSVTPEVRLVDLPGYGYAKVPEKLKIHWSKTIEEYLTTRNSLRGLVQTMDIRHPLRPQDVQLLDWCNHSGLRVRLLLTKADKLGSSRMRVAVETVRNLLADQPLVSVQAFSSTKGTGVVEARQCVLQWVNEVENAD